MSIPFDNLPFGLKTSVIEKFTYEQFGKFEECSYSTYDFCDLKCYLKFPYKVKHLVFRHGNVKLVRNIATQTYKISGFGNAIIQTEDINFWEPVQQKHLDFLLKNVKGIVSVSLRAADSFPPELYNLLKEFKPKILNIDVSVVQNDFPTDFRNVDEVHIENGASLTRDVAFSVKARKIVVVEDIFLSAEQTFELLRDNKVSLNQKLILQRVQKFEIADFIALMMKNSYPSKNKNIHSVEFRVKSLKLHIRYWRKTEFHFLSFEKNY